MLRTNTVILLLGSNLEKPTLQLQNAVNGIRENIGEIVRQSRIYRSSAWGKTDQPDFLNQAVSVKTLLSPEEVLHQTSILEKKAGRKREMKWGPRIIDIDILYYNDLIVQTEQLSIPHPEILKRRFTLMPLDEIIPDYLHPACLLTQSALLQNCMDTGTVMAL